jgi:hypothetical protein
MELTASTEGRESLHLYKTELKLHNSGQGMDLTG